MLPDAGKPFTIPSGAAGGVARVDVPVPRHGGLAITTPADLPAAAAFDERADDYDRWFDDNDELYRAELVAVEELLTPIRDQHGPDAPGLEIGVGTGRFAAPLGIPHGVEPAPQMARVARARGVTVTDGVAENLPYLAAEFAYTVFITALCFVTDPARALSEARRVTRDDGAIVVVFLNPASPAGKQLTAGQADDPYYVHARLRTPEEITALLDDAGFEVVDSRQVTASPEGTIEVRPGTDAGLFCGYRAVVRG